MFENKYTDEMIFLYERSKKLLEEIYIFHKKQKIYNYSNANEKDILYLLSFLTELELINEKIEELSMKVRKAKFVNDLNFDVILYTKLLKVQEKIEQAKKMEKKFCRP